VMPPNVEYDAPHPGDCGRGCDQPRWWYSCRNLLPSGDCGIYSSRPQMCRAYPYDEGCQYAACTWKTARAERLRRLDASSQIQNPAEACRVLFKKPDHPVPGIWERIVATVGNVLRRSLSERLADVIGPDSRALDRPGRTDG